MIEVRSLAETLTDADRAKKAMKVEFMLQGDSEWQ